MKVKVPAVGFQTPGGFYDARVFDNEWYYVVDGNKIVKTNEAIALKYGYPVERSIATELPCRVKVLLTHSTRVHQVYDVFLEDSRFASITATDEAVTVENTVSGPCTASPWYDTVGSHLEFNGEKSFIGGVEVSVGKRKITGFHFPLHRDVTRIGENEYTISYTQPYSRDAVDKLLSGKRVRPHKLVPGLPKKTAAVVVGRGKISAVVPGRRVPFIGGISFTTSGVVYTKLLFRNGIADVFVPPWESGILDSDSLEDVPEEYIMDFREVPIIIDVPPDSVQLPPGRVVIKKGDFTIEVDDRTITISDGVTTARIQADIGMYLSDLLDMFYML